MNTTPPKPPRAHLAAWFYLLQEQEEEGAAAPSVSGVYFICPLTGDVVRKDQKEKHLREAIEAVSALFLLFELLLCQGSPPAVTSPTLPL